MRNHLLTVAVEGNGPFHFRLGASLSSKSRSRQKGLLERRHSHYDRRKFRGQVSIIYIFGSSSGYCCILCIHFHKRSKYALRLIINLKQKRVEPRIEHCGDSCIDLRPIDFMDLYVRMDLKFEKTLPMIP